MNFEGKSVGEVAAKINAELFGASEKNVTDVTHDSRQATNGFLFTAIRGLTMDGHRFVEDVMRRGAVGVISATENPPEFFQGAWLKVENAREAMAHAADIINGNRRKN